MTSTRADSSTRIEAVGAVASRTLELYCPHSRMPLQPLKLAVLHYQPKGEELDPVVTEVVEACQELGHHVTKVGVDDRVQEILRDVQKSKCDLVFNLCETF